MEKTAEITPSNAQTYEDWMFLARRADRRAGFASALKPDVFNHCRHLRRTYIEEAIAVSKQPCVLAWVNDSRMPFAV